MQAGDRTADRTLLVSDDRWLHAASNRKPCFRTRSSVTSATAPRPFSTLSGQSVQVPTVAQTARATASGHVALSLPYEDHAAELLLMVPDAGTFGGFAAWPRNPRIGE